MLQVIWVLYNLKKLDFVISFKLSNLKITQDVKQFFRKFIPGAIGAGVTQINIWVDIVIATFFSGAVAYLYYADRVNQLPLSIVATAMGTALLPTLSKNIAAKKYGEANKNFNNSLIIVLVLTIPATAAFLAISEELIAVLFERGEFKGDATISSAKALAIYSLGLPAFALIKILSSCFFAIKDTKTPVYSACYSLIINIVLNVSFVLYFKENGIQPHLGLALATSISGWFNAIYLYFSLKSQSKFSYSAGFVVKLLKILLSSILMAIAIIYLFKFIGVGVMQMLIVVSTGIIVYFASIIILKVISIKDVRLLRRR